MPPSQSRKKFDIQLCFLLVLLNFQPGTGALRCRVPYEKVQENYCYFIVDDDPLHTSFHNFCYQDKRTSRVCLESQEEMIVLANYLHYIGFQNGTKFWSAGHRWPGDMRFYWNYFGRARELNYTNWAENEPSPRMGKNCIILTLQGGELIMSSESCYTKAVDICEQTLFGSDEARTVIH
ncbi:uncharacterized protein Dwil_GK23828 [Drosophila willistoni]|uniref:C-type lectin domain-containing protein n=1 Tax=Drosophila willistoni TaxID=7260 RepID=B4MTH8_DROWI|nr:uncharacterized protein LOC6641523 [Drosophila willistoni]EDW75417.1 uncharacterized protein Dwil_GK23828 [Drosophila willistoni]